MDLPLEIQGEILKFICSIYDLPAKIIMIPIYLACKFITELINIKELCLLSKIDYISIFCLPIKYRQAFIRLLIPNYKFEPLNTVDEEDYLLLQEIDGSIMDGLSCYIRPNNKIYHIRNILMYIVLLNMFILLIYLLIITLLGIKIATKGNSLFHIILEYVGIISMKIIIFGSIIIYLLSAYYHGPIDVKYLKFSSKRK